MVAAERIPDDEIDFWGGCPKCGRNDGHLNVGRDHYFFCQQHQVFWWLGSNFFTTWEWETQDDWQQNHEMLSKFCEVECLDYGHLRRPAPKERHQ